MTDISPLAVIDETAQIAPSVHIGPFCVIGPQVIIDTGCELINNITIQGQTRIGPDNVFYPNVVIGTAPQDLKYEGGPTKTDIGARNVFRENCTVHRGTELGGGKTIIGNDNLFMAGVHIAHDCIIEDKVLLANQTQLAGHVKIETGSVVSAMVGLHHFVTVGKFSYVGGLTPVRRDVPPFVKFSGDPNAVRAINEEGLRRHGFSPDDIRQIKLVFRRLFRRGNNALSTLDELENTGNNNPHVNYLIEFVRRSCQSRFYRYREAARQDTDVHRKNRMPLEVRQRGL